MRPFNRLHGRTLKPEPNPRTLSDAEIMRARFARWLRQAHKSGQSIPDLIERIDAEPSDSDWLPGIDNDPKRDRS